MTETFDAVAIIERICHTTLQHTLTSGVTE